MEQNMDKLLKLLEHWAEHNHSHAQNYREWATKAQQANKAEVASELSKVAELTDEITAHFERAKRLLQDI
jgi:hypothetical protein